MARSVNAAGCCTPTHTWPRTTAPVRRRFSTGPWPRSPTADAVPAAGRRWAHCGRRAETKRGRSRHSGRCWEAVERGSSATLAATALVESGTAQTEELARAGTGASARGAVGARARGLRPLSGGDFGHARGPRSGWHARACSRARIDSRRPGRELSRLAQSDDPSIGAPALDNLARVQRRLGAGGEGANVAGADGGALPGKPRGGSISSFSAPTRTMMRAASPGPWTDTVVPRRWRPPWIAPVWRACGWGSSIQAPAITSTERRSSRTISRISPTGGAGRKPPTGPPGTGLRLGDRARAAEHVALVTRGDPLSYYAFLGAELLGESYDPDLDRGPAVRRSQAFFWMYEPLREAGLLRRSGMTSAARDIVERLTERAGDAPGALLRLAEGLIAEGMYIEGIRVGGRAQNAGHPRTPRLVRAAYPLPYRDVIFDEAAKHEVDPFLMAALIRQESAFDAGIVSSAGAVGLIAGDPRDRARTRAPGGTAPLFGRGAENRRRQPAPGFALSRADARAATTASCRWCCRPTTQVLRAPPAGAVCPKPRISSASRNEFRSSRRATT